MNSNGAQAVKGNAQRSGYVSFLLWAIRVGYLIGLCLVAIAPHLAWLVPRGEQFNILGQRLHTLSACDLGAPPLVRADGFTAFVTLLSFASGALAISIWRRIYFWVMALLVIELVVFLVVTLLAGVSVHLLSSVSTPQYSVGIGWPICIGGCLLLLLDAGVHLSVHARVQRNKC